ncbi:hypothetical protein NT6N_17860 [Oceaniferula spumae]|uniref:O-antigen ligase-related domain-containing protein n=1 Tax=Oceaniferula spumae TaxID=2979115 RepID=A0AAT9FL71_9BACT
MLGTTISLPLQSPSLILLGVSGLLGAVLALRTDFNIKMLLPVILAICYLVYRAVTSPVMDLALEDIFLILAAGILYLVSGHVIEGNKIRLSLAAIILLMLCLHIGSALMQFTDGAGYSFVRMFSQGVSPIWQSASEIPVKITGMYGYQGSFANFVSMAGLLALSLGLWGRFGKWIRLLLCLFSALALACACLAQSRSAMIGMVAGGVALLLLLWVSFNGQGDELRRRLRKYVLLIGCAGLITGGIAAKWVFVNRAPTEEKQKLTFNTNARLGYWPMAVEQFADHPVIGAGSRSFSYECFQYWNPNLASYEANPEFVHNEYLQVMADYGIVGFLLVMALLLIHLIIGVRRVVYLSSRVKKDGFKEGANAMALAIAGVSGMVVMLVHVIFDFRMHILANLLLFVCCTIWVLPVAGSQKIKGSGGAGRWLSYVIAIVLMIMGGASVGLGYYHLKGGMPLLKNRMGSEVGLWKPQAVQRSIWIPALEESVKLAPSYRRLLKLGALYRLEATELHGDERKTMLKKAISMYDLAAQRHPYDPVSQVNLAEIHGYLEEYEKADQHFQHANHLGAARRFWLKIDLKWAEVLRLRAGKLWRDGNVKEARKQYQRAYELLEPLEIFREEPGQAFVRVTIEYVALLDATEDYEASDALVDDAKSKLPNGIIYSKTHYFLREIGEHYLRKAKFLWYKRQPNEAYEALLLAEKNYSIHKTLLKGESDKRGTKGYDEVKQILEFFKQTGVGENE